MEIQREDGSVVSVADDDPVALALVASGRASLHNSANLPVSDPANVNEVPVQEAAAEEQETPERPVRSRAKASQKETR